MADDQSDPDEGLLVSFVAGRDIECPRCSYNIRGLSHARCPECGIGLRLTVGSVEPYMMRWVAAVIAMAFPAGVGLLLLSFLLSKGDFDLFRQGPLVALGIFGFLVAMPIVLALTIWRRRFIRSSKPVQWGLVLVCVTYSGMAFLLWVVGRGR